MTEAPVREKPTVQQELEGRFPGVSFRFQPTRDDVPTVWAPLDRFHDVLRYLKDEAPGRYRVLYDLTAIDERLRVNRQDQDEGDFTVVYHLLSYDRNEDIRLKIALRGEYPTAPTVTDLWQSADWYEREVYDMFGIKFDGHRHMRRILMPPGWVGHPLRKEHPARATEMGPFQLPESKAIAEQEALHFDPEEWGLQRQTEDTDFMFLNLGPHHPGTHGVLRLILQLDGEEIIDVVPDIGYHHRGAEKMGERQSWHTYIPYTDRVDYLGGVMNNFPYCLAVERLAGIDVPDRAKLIRIMTAELFRIASHLVWYGTFAQDLGAMSPVFYMFNDREAIFRIIEAVCGFRMHPAWFRIGGVTADLPDGWDGMVRDFIKRMRTNINEYTQLVLDNKLFQRRTKGIGGYTLDDAIDWGVTGPMLRACGFEWDWRKKRPYGGYDQLDFEIPTAVTGDCYDRALVRVEEIRQSLRIIEQCVDNMPPGDYKSRHPLATPPVKDRTMHDIETLIDHFLSVSWGPVVPPGEAIFTIEATKGANGYYLISDGGNISYRTRIRTPSFCHMQTVPLLSRGFLIPDLLAILGSMDYVLADIDR